MTNGSHSTSIAPSDLPKVQSVQHILNWFPVDYDFQEYQDYMYGGRNGQKFYYWMYQDAPQLLQVKRGGGLKMNVEARAVRNEDYVWAVDVFNALDNLLEIDFELTTDQAAANFRLYGTTNHGLVEKLNDDGDYAVVGGFADGVELSKTGYVDVVVNVDAGIDFYGDSGENDPKNTNTALHEIGHALGLSHPGLPPHHENRTGIGTEGIIDIPKWDLYDSDDTIMSYNHPPGRYGQTFTEGDILALQQIWGAEGEYKPSGKYQPSFPTSAKDELNIIYGKPGKGKLKASPVIDTFYFNVFDSFGKARADKIIKFDSKSGDKIAFNDQSLPGLVGDEFTFYTVKSKRQFKKSSRIGADIVYYKKKGQLFYDGNGVKKGWGEKMQGGLFAQIEKNTELSVTDLIFYDL